MRRFTMLAVLAACAAGAGCAGTTAVAPVAGLVTLNGKPLAGASVEFQPIGSQGVDPGSMAKTDKDSRFVLKMQLPPFREGAVRGKHQVRIYVYTELTAPTLDADSGGRKKSATVPLPLIPPRFNSSSELTVEVPAAGLPDHHFKLISP